MVVVAVSVAAAVRTHHQHDVAQIERVDFEGSFALVHGRFDGGTALTASVPSTRLADAPVPGSRAGFGFDAGHAVVLGDG